MNLEFELFRKYTKEPFVNIYKEKINSLLKMNDIYVMSNIDNGVFVVPVKETNWGIVQTFESYEIAELYISENQLNGYVKIDCLSVNSLLLMLEKLFYKGVTGILFNCVIDEPRTIYIPMPLLFKDIEDTLVTANNQPIIRLLVKALYTNDYLNYLHHPTLNADEISIGIIRYVLRFDGKNNYIDMFENRITAEKYCYKKGIEKNAEYNCKKTIKNNKDNEKVLSEIGDNVQLEKYPITTIMNSVLFHSIKLLLEKEYKEKEEIIQNIELKKKENPNYELKETDKKLLALANNKKSNLKIKIHSQDKIYEISMDDFMQLVINVGFEQLDLS